MTLTLFIILVTSIVSWTAYDKENVMRRFSMSPYYIKRSGQYYRFLTSGFLHANFSHLLWNVLSLYFFGSVVEQYFDLIFKELAPVYYLSLYFFAMIVADIPTYLKQKSNNSYSSIGASGSIAAVIFVSIIFQPLEQICFYFVFCLPGFILGIGYLMWSYYQSRNANDHISHESHLYGALFGIFFCLITVPASLPHFVKQLAAWQPF